MPPPLILDLSDIDLNAKPLFDREAIEKINPQRFEMQHLDAILWYNKKESQILGYKEVTDKEFWIRGHIPEQPLMPGVIMIEAAAQLSCFFLKEVFEEPGFIGFAGIEGAKFRSMVEPGQRLYLLGQIIKYNKRERRTRVETKVQGVVNGKMVFETVVAGMRVI